MAGWKLMEADRGTSLKEEEEDGDGREVAEIWFIGINEGAIAGEGKLTHPQRPYLR